MSLSISYGRWARLAVALILACFAAAAGCGKLATTGAAPDSDHDHLHEHDHVTPEHRPRDYGEAVAQIANLHATIAEELEEGHARHALDTIEILLDILRWLPEIAADSDMPETQWNTVHTTAAALGRLYGTLHDAARRQPDALDGKSLVQASPLIDRLRQIADEGTWNNQ